MKQKHHGSRILLPLQILNAVIKGGLSPEEVNHSVSCTVELCGRCKFGRLSKLWQQKFQLDPLHPEYGSWLGYRITPEDGWNCGCECCAYAGNHGALAEFRVNSVSGLQSCNFAKHQQSPHHKAAAIAYVLDKASEGNAAPPVSFFKDLLEDIAKGSASTQGRKAAQGVWCLNEALKFIDRRFLANAESISLFRDERKGRLNLRFRAVGKKLEVRCGMMGQEREFGTGAANITKATCKIVQRMCTTLHGCKFNTHGVKSKLNKKILRRIRKNVFMITVDAAADEVLSGEMMRCNALYGGCSKLFENLKFVLRDKTHGSRRSLLSDLHLGVDVFVFLLMLSFAVSLFLS